MSNAIFWNDHKKLHEQKTDLAPAFTLPAVNRRLPVIFTVTATWRQHLPVAVTGVFRFKIKKYKSQKNGYRYSKNGKIYSANGKVNPTPQSP